jgi:hypothetical protein
MATRKKKVVIKKEEIIMLNNKDLVDILKEEMSPSAKLVNLNIYTVGYRLKMHPGEIHQALSELKHHKSVEPGQERDTINVRR